MTVGNTAVVSALPAIGGWLGDTLGGSWEFVGEARGSSHSSLVFSRAKPDSRVVVRLEPASGPFPSYDVVAEAQLVRSLDRAGICVPRVVGQESTGEVCGSPFIVTDLVSGRVVVPGSIHSDGERRTIVSSLLATLAGVQAVELEQLDSGARRFGRTFDDIALQFAETLNQLRYVDASVLEFARAWMASTRGRIKQHGPVLVHGDFRLGNMIWLADGRCCILDWEAAHIGSNLFDLAWLCMGAVDGTDPVMGLMSKEGVVACYEEITSTSVSALDMLWWQVAAAWVRGCMEVRLLDRYLSGGSSGLDRDPQELLWEFGSYRTDNEILTLIDRFDRQLEGA
jgi:aminoglycoside phosphotransferase (APT) family kinase protein